MRNPSNSQDYIVIPETKSKGVSNKSSQLHNSISDSSRNRHIKQFQEEIDRLKLENYHLKDQLGHHHQQNSKIQDLQLENEQLKEMVKNNGNERGQSQTADKYDRALREISKLLKINNELRVQLEYLKERNEMNQEQGDLARNNEELLEELRKCEERNHFLEKQLEGMKYHHPKDPNEGTGDADIQIFELENRLKEKELDFEEIKIINEKNEREFIGVRNRLQKALEDQDMQLKITVEELKLNELEYREQIEEYEKRERSNERELEAIKTEAGFFHNEIKDLKEKLEQLESINEELRREVNRDESSISDSSTFGELKVYINNLNNQVDNLRQFNLTKDTNELIAENQMFQRQIFGLNNRNSLLEKENAELKINVQEYIRKFQTSKNKHETLTQIHSELEANYLKKEQRLAKFERDNELLKEKILHPEVRKAIADVEASEDIDIEELKVKVRNCILILELFLNDPSQPLSPKQIQVEELHKIKTLLIEINIKVKSLVEENNLMKKMVNQNQQIINELEDVNSRLGSQSKGYEQLIRKLEEEFQRSISRNENIEKNYEREWEEQMGYMKEQSVVEIKHMKQELETRALDYEVKLSCAKNSYKKSEISIHNAYSKKQEELTSKLRELEKAHGEAIRQLRLLGPEKQETIARLYSSIHDLELELKLYKSKNQIADKSIEELNMALQIKQEANEILQNNIKVILSSQGQNLESLENFKLKEKDYLIKNQRLSKEVTEFNEKIKALQAANIGLQSELQITQEEAAEFYHRSQNVTNKLNTKTYEFQTSKDQQFTQVTFLNQRIQILMKQREELEEIKLKQEKYHNSQVTILRKNYEQKMDVLEKNYQESRKSTRFLQQKVDNLTLINIQLLAEHRKLEEREFEARAGDPSNEAHKGYFLDSHLVHERFIGS